MYTDFIFYLKTLLNEGKTKQVFWMLIILGIICLFGITIEIFEKKCNKQYDIITKFLSKLNVFNKQIKKDV